MGDFLSLADVRTLARSMAGQDQCERWSLAIQQIMPGRSGHKDQKNKTGQLHLALCNFILLRGP